MTPSSSTASIATSPTPSISLEDRSHTRTPTAAEIAISIGSVILGVVIILTLVYVMSRCRPRHQKYKHPEDGPDLVVVESTPGIFVTKPSKDDLRQMSKPGEAIPLVTTQTHDRNESQYFPSSPFVNHYESLATLHATHTVSLGSTQRPRDNVGLDTATLFSVQQSPPKPRITLPPLSIPEKPSNRSNVGRSIKRPKPSNHPDSSLEGDDAASIYSQPSAYLESPIAPPPVPPIPTRFIAPTQSTLPKSTNSDVMVIARKPVEGTIIKSLPSSSRSAQPLPLVKSSREEAGEDETEIYNVAKLLRSRQTKLPNTLNVPSRNTSTVSHIERSGSINPVLSPAGAQQQSESYRPRYNRSKQKMNTGDSDASNPPPNDITNPFLSTLPPAHSRNSQWW